MKKLLLSRKRHTILDPDGLILDDVFRKLFDAEILLPDGTTDWRYDPASGRIYYVVDGEIRTIIIYEEIKKLEMERSTENDPD